MKDEPAKRASCVPGMLNTLALPPAADTVGATTAATRRLPPVLSRLRAPHGVAQPPRCAARVENQRADHAPRIGAVPMVPEAPSRVLSGLGAKMLSTWRRTISFSPKSFAAGWAIGVGTGKRDFLAVTNRTDRVEHWAQAILDEPRNRGEVSWREQRGM